MNYLPDISVIVCSYNHGMWLERCIRSLTHQIHIAPETYEIIIVDDGSMDDTDKVLDNITGIPNIRIIKNDTNIGLPASLNKAIQQARGRYIVRVDSDDYVTRQFLYLTQMFLDMNRQYQAVAVDYVVVDRFEQYIRKVNCFEEEIACGVMFRKECLFEIGLYDETFKMREGHDLRRRFLEKFKMARLEFPLYKYREHDTNRTKNKEELDQYDKKLGDSNE
jgi:glycosyltransferase involved in cell wall biosynthesis